MLEFRHVLSVGHEDGLSQVVRPHLELLIQLSPAESESANAPVEV